MRNLFDVRPAKVELRRQFEKREWKSDETFGTYFYDKVILAGRVPVNEDELVDYLIDGIPDRFLQNQARMQRFVRKDMLLRAFENIKLRPENKGKHGRDSNVVASDKSKQGKPGVPQKNENKAEGTRCYNCNQTGHRMKECTKPKRDQGSCYECGVQGHGMRDCPQRQKKTTPTTEPEPKQSTASQMFGLSKESRPRRLKRKIVYYKITWPKVSSALRLVLLLMKNITFIQYNGK
ncbi:uncharacterized protein [Temnothorax nylanderi]|uniref:uncharacterized protein isoform X1 n=1 Tax=Temnothorax nylanderi TaxID=102681 RepID=UPI003A8A406A